MRPANPVLTWTLSLGAPAASWVGLWPASLHCLCLGTFVGSVSPPYDDPGDSGSFRSVPSSVSWAALSVLAPRGHGSGTKEAVGGRQLGTGCRSGSQAPGRRAGWAELGRVPQGATQSPAYAISRQRKASVPSLNTFVIVARRFEAVTPTSELSPWTRDGQGRGTDRRAWVA